MRVAALVGVVWLLCSGLVRGDADGYDALCDKIIALNRQAAQAHSQGDAAAAQAAVDEAVQTFHAARRLDPTNPQAALNIAVFMLNTNHFDDALVYWDLTRELVAGNADLVRMCDDKIKLAKFGKVSMQRDAVYDHARGDIHQAIELTHEQLELYKSPDLLFDLGTFEAMASETDQSLEHFAADHFLEAQQVAASAHVTMLSHRDGRGGACKGERGLVRWDEVYWQEVEWEGRHHAYGQKVRVRGTSLDAEHELDLRFGDTTMHIVRLTNMALSGGDGVIVGAGANGDCRVFVAHKYVNLATNIQTVTTWDPNNMRLHDPFKGKFRGANVAAALRLGRAATIVGYASSAYYHFALEATGRLLALLPVLQANADMKLIVPTDRSDNGFVSQFLDLLLPRDFDRGRLVWYDTSTVNDVRVVAEELFAVQWRAPSHRRPVHAVMPAQGLRTVRGALLHAVGTPDPPLPRRVVFCTRGSASMRQLEGEEALVGRLREALEQLAIPVELSVFAGDASNITQTGQLFASAMVVVGVHGGALANVVFCKRGTTVVEIGFRTSFSHHYAHASMALELEYVPVWLHSDEGSVSREHVRFEDEPSGVAAVVEEVTAAVQRHTAHVRDEL